MQVPLMHVEANEYVHGELNREVTAIGRHYVLSREVRMPFQGREILYVMGYAVLDTTCCGTGGLAYVHVPGFVLDWQGSKNGDGLAVSLVEPIRDKDMQREIRRLIEKTEVVHQIQF